MRGFVLGVGLLAALGGCSDQRPANSDIQKEDIMLPESELATPPQAMWKYARSRNDAKKTSIVFAKLQSDPLSDGSRYEIEIRHERPGVTEAFLTRGSSYFCEGLSDQSVTVAPGEGSPVNIKCQPSKTGHGASALGYDQIDLLEKMSKVDQTTLTLRRSSGDEAVVFRTKGFTLQPSNAPNMVDVLGAW